MEQKTLRGLRLPTRLPGPGTRKIAREITMLIQRLADRPHALIGLGQACLFAGILSLGPGIIAIFTDSPSLPDFARGFLAGLGSTLIGFSVVLNVTGLRRTRPRG